MSLPEEQARCRAIAVAASLGAQGGGLRFGSHRPPLQTRAAAVTANSVSPLQLANELRHALHGDFDLRKSGCEAAAHMALPSSSERRPWHNGDFLFLQQSHAEVAAGKAGGRDFRENVERSARAAAFEAHFVEGGDDEVPAHFVFAAHLRDAVLAAVEGFDGGILSHDRCTQDRVLVDFHHGLNERRRRAGETDAPTGHGKSLGETVEKDRALFHSRKNGNAGVLGAFVGQLAVDFIREDNEIMTNTDCGDFFEFRRLHRGAGRIRREIQHESAGAGCDDLFQILGAQGKSILRAGADGHGNAMRHSDRGGVRNIAGLVVDHLVAGIQQGAEREIDRFGDAHGDKNLGKRFVADGEMFVDVIGNTPAQARQTEIRGVASAPPLQSVNGRLADVPWRGEVRLADAERDDIIHRLHDFKKVANSRARDIADVVCNGDAHGVTERRSELASKVWKVPFSL